LAGDLGFSFDVLVRESRGNANNKEAGEHNGDEPESKMEK